MRLVHVGLGQRFGRLTVIGSAENVTKKRRYPCKCDCGKITAPAYSDLRAGHAQSCGCLAAELARARRLSHGNAVHSKVTPEYRCWRGILTRCFNPNDKGFKNYGARGIIVCDRWRHSFENFLADMGLRPSADHSLDRYPDNDGPYSPDNCRWATHKEQNRNMRTNHLITVNGETLCLTDWSLRLGVPINTLRNRIVRGMPSDSAVLHFMATANGRLSLVATRRAG